MIDRILQDAVICGTLCPMFGDLLMAAAQGRNSAVMGPLMPSQLNALKENYEALGFACDTRYDLEKNAHMLKVTFAKTFQEINQEIPNEDAKSVEIAP